MPDFGGYNMSEKDPGWKDLKIKTAEKNALRIKGLPVGRKQSKLPVIQGGMGVGISLSGLAGAVASCGGVGLISTAQIGFRRPEFDRDPVSANIAAIKEEFQKARKIAPEGIIMMLVDETSDGTNMKSRLMTTRGTRAIFMFLR